jgi:hypothetical protein
MVLSELSCCVFWDTIVTIPYNSCLDSELNHPLRDDLKTCHFLNLVAAVCCGLQLQLQDSTLRSALNRRA